MAHLSLAGSHRDGAVALQGLDVIESFMNRGREIILGYIFAQTNEAFAIA
jgi:hypothetical protein